MSMMIEYQGTIMAVEDAIRLKKRQEKTAKHIEEQGGEVTEEKGAGFDIVEKKADTIDSLRAQLKELGISFHHRAGEITLRSMLDKALESKKYLEENAKQGELKENDKAKLDVDVDAPVEEAPEQKVEEKAEEKTEEADPKPQEPTNKDRPATEEESKDA